MFHARPFCTSPAEDITGSVVVLVLDLETSGLDVSRDLVVEIAATEVPCDTEAYGASFATVVSGVQSTGEAPGVHGIEQDDIAQGPNFEDAWRRFVAFADGLLNLALQEESDDSDAEFSPRPRQPPFEPPKILIVAHNVSQQ